MKAKYLLALLLVVTLLRGAWVLSHEVSASEAYYWICSRHLSTGYFDGPSGPAFLVRAFGDHFQLARLFWPVMAFFFSWVLWLFARRMVDETVAGWCVVFLNVLPVFNLAAIRVGPLLPALISTVAGLVFARVAWEGKRWAWPGAGVFFAVALLFRYEALLVPAGLIIAALSSSRHRTPGDLLGLLSIILLSALALWPSLLWNASVEWIPVAGGTLKTAWEFRWDPFVKSLIAIVSAFSVPVAVAILPGLVFLLRDARLHGRAIFLSGACGIVWVWALYVLLRGGDAVTPAAIGIVPLSVFVIFSLGKNRLATGLGVFSLAVALAATCFSLWTQSRVSWKSVADDIRAAARDLPAAEGGSFFIAEGPDEAAALGFYLPGEGSYPPVFVPESPALTSQFGLWPSYADFVESDVVTDEYFKEQHGVNPFLGRNAIYVGADLPQTIKGAFEEVRPYRTVVSGDGRSLTIYFCLGYQTLPL